MFKRLRDVPYVQIPRLSTGVEELDWIYGGDGDNWGLPQGKISLWSGPSGTGKSKSLIRVAKNMSSVGHKVMYFQNEVTLGDFRAWVGEEDLPPTFYGSEATALDEQISDIVQSGATLAIVDSVNQIDEFGGGHKSAIQKIYKRYRQVTKATGVHIIFICQLDKQLKLKGGADLLFLADIAIGLGFHIVNKKALQHHFTVHVGSKHRYGKMGEDMTTLWKHSDTGANCVSNNRQRDAAWCRGQHLRIIESAPLCHEGVGIVDEISGGLIYMPDPEFFKKKVCK
jgi:predicted ATP-dependent serine protease